MQPITIIQAVFTDRETANRRCLLFRTDDNTRRYTLHDWPRLGLDTPYSYPHLHERIGPCAVSHSLLLLLITLVVIFVLYSLCSFFLFAFFFFFLFSLYGVSTYYGEIVIFYNFCVREHEIVMCVFFHIVIKQISSGIKQSGLV